MLHNSFKKLQNSREKCLISLLFLRGSVLGKKKLVARFHQGPSNSQGHCSLKFDCANVIWQSIQLAPVAQSLKSARMVDDPLSRAHTLQYCTVPPKLIELSHGYSY